MVKCLPRHQTAIAKFGSVFPTKIYLNSNHCPRTSLYFLLFRCNKLYFSLLINKLLKFISTNFVKIKKDTSVTEHMRI